MTVTIIDYGSGNLRSAQKAFERAVNELNIKKPIIITSEPELVLNSERVILPGVGSFIDCKRGLQSLPGMIEAIEEFVFKKTKPFLGICVGMQLMADSGIENGRCEGLGWISGEVLPIITNDQSLKIPHMGWNELKLKKTHHLFKNIKSGEHVYFVHSYGFKCNNLKNILATVDYGNEIIASISKDNIAATQFHPEKSQATGLQFIKNFLTWKP